MKEFKKATIADYIDKAGYEKKDGKLVKTKNAEELEIAREEEIKKIVNNPKFDPIHGKDHSNKLFEKKSEISLDTHIKKMPIEFLNDLAEEFEDPSDVYGNIEDNNTEKKFIDEFTNEDSLYNFTKKENNIDYDDKIEEFENNLDPLDFKGAREEKKQRENRKKGELKSLPEYTNFEKNSLQTVVKNYINNKEQFIGEKKLSKEQINEAVNEFKQSFPEDFAKMVHRKLVRGEFKWKKETFKDKDILVNYYPTPENPIIKYVLNLNDKDSSKKEPITKVFINNSVKETGKAYRDKNGVVLIFCSKPKKILKIKR